MSEEESHVVEQDAADADREEIYIPIFMDLCDLTTDIINLFITRKIKLECKENRIHSGTYGDRVQKIIKSTQIFGLGKYDMNDFNKKLSFLSSNIINYPPIFYVKLSDLIKKYNVTQNNKKMDDDLKKNINILIKYLNDKYYPIKNSSKETYYETSTQTSGYYGDDVDSTTEVSKDTKLIEILYGDYMNRLKKNILSSTSGGKPLQKKEKNTKRNRTKRKNAQKKNTKKRSRK